jgi:phage-related protein
MGWRLVQYKGAYDALMVDCTSTMRDALKPRLAQLLRDGNQAKYPVTEPLGEGLFEVRARAGRVRIRVLFGFLPGQRIVVVWGGTKDQRTLAQKTIKAARRLLQEAKATVEMLDVIRIN